MNKPVYLKLAILELSKTLIYEFWYDIVKPKYREKAKLCFIDTESFTVYIETDYIYKDISEDVETKFGSLKEQKVIGLMKDELGEKIMNEFLGLRAKTYSYLINDGSEGNKAKGTKKCVIKRKPEFEDYKNCLVATHLENKINHLKKMKLM